jgi:hypothetical protein
VLNPPNRRGTDPYARWCGRGGIARCPPIPIDHSDPGRQPHDAAAPVKAALDELAIIGEPVNRVLEVDLDAEEVTLTLYDLSPA